MLRRRCASFSARRLIRLRSRNQLQRFAAASANRAMLTALRSFAFFPTRAYSPDDHANDYRDDQQNGTAAAYPLHQKRQALAEEITECGNDDGPKDRAGDVVNKKDSPPHFA